MLVKGVATRGEVRPETATVETMEPRTIAKGTAVLSTTYKFPEDCKSAEIRSQLTSVKGILLVSEGRVKANFLLYDVAAHGGLELGTTNPSFGPKFRGISFFRNPGDSRGRVVSGMEHKYGDTIQAFVLRKDSPKDARVVCLGRVLSRPKSETQAPSRELSRSEKRVLSTAYRFPEDCGNPDVLAQLVKVRGQLRKSPRAPGVTHYAPLYDFPHSGVYSLLYNPKENPEVNVGVNVGVFSGTTLKAVGFADTPGGRTGRKAALAMMHDGVEGFAHVLRKPKSKDARVVCFWRAR